MENRREIRENLELVQYIQLNKHSKIEKIENQRGGNQKLQTNHQELKMTLECSTTTTGAWRQ